MVSVALPHDIWLQIASFLPRHTVDVCFALNRAFLDHALNLRYHALSLAELPPSRLDLFRLRRLR